MTAIDDLEERKAIWLAFSDLFLDTDVTLFYDHIVDRCAASRYSIDELEAILKTEVAPACSFNMRLVAGEWAGFDEEWLWKRTIRVIGSRRTMIGKLLAIISVGDAETDEYVGEHWDVLTERIRNARRAV